MKYILFSILFIFIVSCAQKTSTPKEYMNINKVSKDIYRKDLYSLADALKFHYDSINSVVNTRNVTKLLNVKIDTIFYNNDNKIVFLAVLTKENDYAKKGIQYSGECYIGYKKSNIEDIYQLKYSSTSTKSLKEVSEMIRKTYLVEMNYIKGRHNINDTRFWDSYVWQEAKEMREKGRNFEEMKKNHPENVYNPNDRK